MTEPTDAELDELRQANSGRLNFVTLSEFRTIARAVLAKWGTQPQAGAVPLTDEQSKALMQARRTAMLMTCKARVPECGEFAAIAQDLDWLCESLGIKGGQHGTE